MVAQVMMMMMMWTLIKVQDGKCVSREIIMYRPTTLSIITTYKCTAACEHCCFHCTPSRNEGIPPENILEYISQAAEVPSIELVVFTGGECFTLGDHLIEAISLASSLGLATRCVTNGYWAKTDQSANSWLQKLKKAGLTEINFSTGDHHSKYVPLNTVLRGVHTMCEAGVPTAVNIELFEESKTKPILKSVFRQWQEKYPKLSIHYGLWIPNGGKTKLKHSDFFQWKQKQTRCRGCDSVLSTLAIRPDEKIIDCCGLYLDYVHEMIVGDLKYQTIPEIIKKKSQNEDFLKIWIAIEGAEAVLTHASKYNPKIRVKETYVHPCQACLLLYKKTEFREAIFKACEEHMERVYSLYRSANFLQDTIKCLDLKSNREVFREFCV